MSHQTGDLLGGRYRLDDRIAVGGMGEVWKATDTLLRRAIALKTLRHGRAGDQQFRTRFQQEARAMAALHHPGIADIYDFGEEPGDDAYLVMARVNGQSLDRRIAGHGRLPVAETMSIVAQVAHALQAAHQAGIVHRDVKPGNIIVQPDGQAVLVDFGVARSAGSATLTGAEEVVGTAHYIAPEQVAKQPVGPATDVYALGAVAYHCLAGRPPFFGDSPLEVAMQHLKDEPPDLPADVPPEVRAVVATALAKEPLARFPTAAAMARAAEHAAQSSANDKAVNAPGDTVVLTGLRTGSAAPPPQAPPRISPPGGPHDRRRMVLLLALALLVLAGAATALALAYPFDRAPAPPPASTSAPVAPTPSTTGSKHEPPPAATTGADTGTHSPSPSASTKTSHSPSPSPSTSTSRSPSASPTTPSRAPATTPPATPTVAQPPQPPATTVPATS